MIKINFTVFATVDNQTASVPVEGEITTQDEFGMMTAILNALDKVASIELPYRLRANRVTFKDGDIRKAFIAAGFLEPSPLTITAQNCTICNRLGSFVQMDDYYEDDLVEM